MKRALALLLALALSPVSSQAEPPSIGDDEAILRATLNYYARQQVPAGTRLCVEPVTIARRLGDGSSGSGPLRPVARWSVIPASGPIVDTMVDPALTQAANAALGGLLQVRVRTLLAEWIPEPLHVGRFRAGCASSISLSSPSIRGEYAFVEIAYACGGLCGDGRLYALRREGGSWRPFAFLRLWIS